MKPFGLTSLPPLREKDIVRQCLAVMNRRGYYPVRIHCGLLETIDHQRFVRGAKHGTPDYGGIHELYPGFLLEVKRPGKKPRPNQVERQWEIRAGFHLAIVTIDNGLELEPWLDRQERLARERWARELTRGP